MLSTLTKRIVFKMMVLFYDFNYIFFYLDLPTKILAENISMKKNILSLKSEKEDLLDEIKIVK